jgi:hypothetical protein
VVVSERPGVEQAPWFASLPPCQAEMPCGSGMHTVRWEAGQLRLLAHPDAEAELVLAALGGEQASCVRLAGAWGRHAEDPAVLDIGPRGPADHVTVSWDDLAQAQQRRQSGWVGFAGVASAGNSAIRFPMFRGHGPRQSRQAIAAELERSRQRRADLMSLLALGTGFQLRLAGHVAAAHAARPAAASRPALSAAIAGRVAPAAAGWIGIDPGQVLGSLHDGGGWGTLALTGQNADRLLRVALPAGWLASVWACGLALVGRHLVVAVIEPGWPDARVLALRAPGAEPAALSVHGTAGPEDTAHWET